MLLADAPAAGDGDALRIDGDVVASSTWSVARIKAELGSEIKVIQYSSRGKQHGCDCVGLIPLLKAAGLPTELKMDPKADPKTKNRALRLGVLVRGRDGYAALFSLAELMPAIGNRAAWLAVDMDGADLAADEAPAKLIVPDDAKPGRWVHGVEEIRVIDESGAATTQPAGAP
jgi:hypothetical protein